jgi:hypothetical protein
MGDCVGWWDIFSKNNLALFGDEGYLRYFFLG